MDSKSITRRVTALLQQCPTKYTPPSRVLSDVAAVVGATRTLLPQVDTLVCTNGITTPLLCLKGTVPIYYNGVQYNIPVNVWIPELYPEKPPEVYVTPTAEMRIKPRHKHVDPNGVVYLPYLHNWTQRASLSELVTFMSSAFSTDPPVFRYTGPSNAAVASSVVRSQQQQPYVHQTRRGSVTSNNSVSTTNSNNSSSSEPRAQRKAELVASVTSALQGRMTRTFRETAAEIDRLFDTQRSLEEGASSVEADLVALQSERDGLTAAKKFYAEQNAACEAFLAVHEHKAALSLEEAVLFADTWSEAAVKAVAADHAIDDTMYVLERQIQEDRIDLAAFLKEIRKLGNRQFRERALARKISHAQLLRAEEKAFGHKSVTAI